MLWWTQTQFTHDVLNSFRDSSFNRTTWWWCRCSRGRSAVFIFLKKIIKINHLFINKNKHLFYTSCVLVAGTLQPNKRSTSFLFPKRLAMYSGVCLVTSWAFGSKANRHCHLFAWSLKNNTYEITFMYMVHLLPLTYTSLKGALDNENLTKVELLQHVHWCMQHATEATFPS